MRKINKKKIAFVKQPSPVLLNGQGEVYSPVRTNLFPIPQVTLASMLKGHDLSLLDLRSIEDYKKWGEEKLTEYGEAIGYGPTTLRRFLIGDYAKRVRNSDKDVDIYVLTANCTYELNSIKITAELLKRKNPEAKIIVGGRDVEALSEVYAASESIDHIVIGNSIKDFQRLIDSNGGLERIINIGRETSIPRPNLNFIELGNYESGGGMIEPNLSGHYAYIQTSRGCPNKCSFCTEDDYITKASVDEVKQTIDYYIKNDIRIFGFIDSNLIGRSNDELTEIFTYLKEKKVSWEFPSGIEVKKLFEKRDDLVDQLLGHTVDEEGKFVGCYRALIPLEDCLIRYSKHTKCQGLDYDAVLKGLIARKIPYANLGVMIGSASETEQDQEIREGELNRIHEMFKDTDTIVNFSEFCSIPIPGTGFHKTMGQKGRIMYDPAEFPELYNVFTSVIQGNHFSPEEITEFRRYSLRKFSMEQHIGKVDPGQMLGG